MHKSWSQNFARPKGRKTRKRTWKSPKRAKSGAFWVLEGMRAVADWCKQMQNPGKLGENQGTDLSRLPPRSALDGRHRRPAPLATLRVPRFRPLPLRKRPELRMQCWSFCVFFPKMMRPTKREVKKTRIYAVFKHFCFLKSSTFQKRCGKLEGQF